MDATGECHTVSTSTTKCKSSNISFQSYRSKADISVHNSGSSRTPLHTQPLRMYIETSHMCYDWRDVLQAGGPFLQMHSSVTSLGFFSIHIYCWYKATTAQL
jgi:hypothetical protein